MQLLLVATYKNVPQNVAFVFLFEKYDHCH